MLVISHPLYATLDDHWKQSHLHKHNLSKSVSYQDLWRRRCIMVRSVVMKGVPFHGMLIMCRIISSHIIAQPNTKGKWKTKAYLKNNWHQ